MTARNEVYKCEICGNIVEILHEGVGTLVCCGQPMTKIVEKVQEVGNEKHLPVLEKLDSGTLIKIGSVPHPMEEKHYIEWIQAFSKDGKILRVFLKPGEAPEVKIAWSINDLKEVREYCNIHGLWSKRV
ncbi:MAG: desulfoferrodoxin [Caldiserica bacterium]|jgi:superoxide reductase|nr:desulfoferrodoxin [Caldisericota bacterium]